VVVFPAARVES